MRVCAHVDVCVPINVCARVGMCACWNVCVLECVDCVYVSDGIYADIDGRIIISLLLGLV